MSAHPYRLTYCLSARLRTSDSDSPRRSAMALARATQIGNAVPPLLAAHILAALTGRAIEVAT